MQNVADKSTYVGLKLTCTPAVNVSLSLVHLSFLLRQNLNKLAELVQGELPKLIRSIIGALITLMFMPETL